MELLKKLYAETFKTEVAQITPLKQAGSNRQYFRLADAKGKTVVGVVGTSKDENHAFLAIAKHFLKKGIAVPKILSASEDEMRYIQEDLGSKALFDALSKGRESGGCYSTEEEELLKKVVAKLPEIQVLGGNGMNWDVCYPQPSFDTMNVMFDLNYFKYCFLKATGVDFHELRLEEDFRHLALELTREDAGNIVGFMYRDFQARNVMLKEGEPFFIDFQGGRKGPVYYDLASFLWQASAKYPEHLRRKLIDVYYNSLKTLADVPNREIFGKRLLLFVFFRTLQVLGAYGFRGYFERKEHFIKSIPPAIANLKALLPEFKGSFPYLTDVLQEVVSTLQKQTSMPLQQQASMLEATTLSKPSVSKYDNQGELVVKVWSFSYKKGIPEDDSGNGGGYVFDCRGTHNPGRYDEYKPLTGLDAPVIRFLEEDGEILSFLENIYPLAERHVRRYMERGFTSLSFAFGCTGGRHRSVYSAQHLAEHLHQMFGVKVILRHREQNIQCILQ